MKWINFGLFAISLGLLFFLPDQTIENATYEVNADAPSMIAIEVLSDEVILLRIQLEPSMPSETVLFQKLKPELEAQTVPLEIRR